MNAWMVFLGGFTTFPTFYKESLALVEREGAVPGRDNCLFVKAVSDLTHIYFA